MKEIIVHKNFTLNHEGKMTCFRQSQKYEVEDDVADHWYVRQHASLAGESFNPEKPEPTVSYLEPMKMVKGAPPYAVEASPKSHVVVLAEEATDHAPEAPQAPEAAPEAEEPAPKKKG